MLRILPFAFLASCGGAAALSPPPEPSTSAKLVEGGCAGEGPRTEVALGVEHGAAWVSVGSERVYTTSRECFALPPADGDHKVVVRARADGGSGGVGLSLRMAHGGREVFTLACGDPGRCDKPTLHAWAAERPRPDPCAGAEIRDLRWDSRGSPDGVHPEDIEVTFRLVTRKPPDTCTP